jgi:iron complex transport system permease protein
MAGETGDPGRGRGRSTTAPGRFDWATRELGVVVAGSAALVLVAGTLQLSFGAYQLTPTEAWRALLDPAVLFSGDAWRAFLLGDSVPAYDTGTLVTWTIRLPRVLVGVLVGMNLAVSGAILQAITRNELASPFVLGVSSGAGLAVLLTVVVFTGLLPYLPLFAAVGGSVAFLLVYSIAWQGGTSPVRLVLAGVIVSSVFGSVQTGLFLLLEDVGVIQSVVAWTTGSLVGTDWAQLRMILPWSVLAVGAALASARQLNVLVLGEQTASSLGMSVERVRFGLAGVAVLAASASVAAAGIVGFVGLVVPHIVRRLVGTDHKQLLVGCAVAGPALLTAADAGARLALRPAQIPVGIVTGLVGGPYFLYLMRKHGDFGGF